MSASDGRPSSRDTGGSGPALVRPTDAPHFVEDYDEVISRLAPRFRMIVVEPPGFGFAWAH